MTDLGCCQVVELFASPFKKDNVFGFKQANHRSCEVRLNGEMSILDPLIEKM